MKLVLVTGGAGGVARMIRPLLREHYRLRLSDIVPVADLKQGEEWATADLCDLAALRGAAAGVAAVLHLGAYSLEADWETIRRANIEGAYNIFEAARLEGVKRFVFASSNHAMGFYPRAETIGVDRTVRPDSRYGVSKVFGEALGSLYADRYGMEVLSIRIGHILPKPNDELDLANWLSPHDFVQMVRIGLESPAVRNEIVYGMSDNRRAWWDNAAALRLGYRPQGRSEDHAEEVPKRAPTGDTRVDLTQGGAFCVVEATRRSG
jgi:uronate dehydrogenase